MERLLTETREISWVDARLGEEERELVALDALLAGLIESFRLRVGEEGPDFKLSVSDRKAVLFASADRLTQVFENLIANAVSFSPSGGIIDLSVRAVEDRAEVVISDSGPGIPAEHLERIFSRFFSYRPDDDHTGHTGLGLALVKAIVEGYGGSVAARPHPGGGADFIVELPLADRS
jgi:two-component system sensor histidine kinase ChvG